MRVYCGLASAGEGLTAAVVDDGGQVAAVQQIEDNPEGYATLLSLLAARSDPGGIMCVPFSSDVAQRHVAQLFLAGGRHACFVDPSTVEKLAAAEPPDAPDDARRAVAMARALYSGKLTATARPTTPELTTLRPLLWAHAALTVSRVAAVAALREVLRELYPAALQAFPDPGGSTALAVLDALPDPVQVTRGQDENVVARLTTAGFKDAADALAALHRSVDEQGSSTVVMESAGATVRQAVAAVLAGDTAASTLIREVVERLDRRSGADPGPEGAPRSDWSAEPASGHDPAAGPADPFSRPLRGESVNWGPPVPSRLDRPVSPAPLLPSRAERPVGPAPLLPGRGERRNLGPAPTRSERRMARARQQSPAPGETPQESPVNGVEPVDRTLQLRGQDDTSTAAFPLTGAATMGEDMPTAERPMLPGEPEPPSLTFPTDFQPSVIDSDDPTDRTGQEDTSAPPLLRAVSVDHEQREASVTALPPLEQLPTRSRRGAEVTPRSRRRPRSQSHEPTLRPPDAMPMPDSGVGDEGDSELLIFAQARSAWFAGEHNEAEWDSLADEGWRAAEAASQPAVGTSTESGLPRRVPQANLVPGSPEVDRDRTPISRDASHLAAQTAGYFRGWQRGRETTGHPLVDRAEAEAFSPAGRR